MGITLLFGMYAIIIQIASVLKEIGDSLENDVSEQVTADIENEIFKNMSVLDMAYDHFRRICRRYLCRIRFNGWQQFYLISHGERSC